MVSLYDFFYGGFQQKRKKKKERDGDGWID